MKKISKNKAGFTLIEMMLVIAIIVILSGVLLVGISKYITDAKSQSAKVDTHNNAASKAEKDVDKLLSSNAAISAT